MKKGFTIVEFMVILALVVVLLALLFPAIHQARIQAGPSVPYICEKIIMRGDEVTVYYRDTDRGVLIQTFPDRWVKFIDDVKPGDPMIFQRQPGKITYVIHIPNFDVIERY